MIEDENTGSQLAEQIDAIIAEYIAAVEAEGPQDPGKWLARYPHVAAELKSYFDDHDQVMRWLDPPLGAVSIPPAGTESLPAKSVPASHLMPGREMQPGDVLGGKYRILDVKFGGMGCVYFVTGIGNRDDEPRAVMKTIMPYHRWRAAQRDDAEPTIAARYTGLLYRFRREAMNWVRLDDHPNIVRAEGVHEIAGRPYLLLHYADSGDLAAWIKAGRLTLPMAVDFALQFCSGMHHAAQTVGLVHRDIKPSNVLIHQQREVKITDLGLARAFVEDDTRRPAGLAARGDFNGPNKTRGGGLNRRRISPCIQVLLHPLSQAGAGTLPYMAPEQFKSLRDADTRSDIFSFGATFFELLTGKRLFDKVHAFEASRDNTRLPLAHEINPSVPATLSAVVSRCVAYDRDARYGSFDEVAKDILATGLSKRWKIRRGAAIKSSSRPKDRRDWNREVFSLVSLGEYEEAERSGNEALQHDPDYHGHWLNKGKALAELKRFEEAHRCYAKAAELAPRDVQCWFNLAYVLNALGRKEEGLEAAQRALAIDANCTEAWDAMGCSQHDVNGPDAALHYFRRAIDADGHNWRAMANLARCLSDLGHDEEALSLLRRSVAVNPDASESWFQIACILGQNQQYAKALEAVDICLRLNDKHAASWSMRGVLLTQIGSSAANLRRAADCFRRAIALDVKDSFAPTLLAQVEAQLDTR